MRDAVKLKTPAPSRRKAPQPTDILSSRDALLTVATVSALTGRSPSSLYRLEKSGELIPVRRGSRCTRWPAGAVTDWLRSQVTP